MPAGATLGGRPRGTGGECERSGPADARAGARGRPRRVRGPRAPVPGRRVAVRLPLHARPSARRRRHAGGVPARVPVPADLPGRLEVLQLAVPDHAQLRDGPDPRPERLRRARHADRGLGRRPAGPRRAPRGARRGLARTSRTLPARRGVRPVVSGGGGRARRSGRHDQAPDAPRTPGDDGRARARGGGAMNHEQAERLLSARIDGERLSSRATAALEHHLESCAECRAFERGVYRLREAARFEVAPAVPDLVDEVMAAVGTEATPSGLRVVRPMHLPRRRVLSRLAPVAAALLVGVLIGSLVVGGPWQRSETGSALAAAEVADGISAAAVHLDAYQATFDIRERNLSPGVPERDLTMRVWFGAPERFRLDVADHTDYPTRTTPTDLQLVVDGSRWYSTGPSACPTAECPRRESVVRNRLPFSTDAPTPTDLVLPISTLADADRVTVLGRGTVLGRPAVEVEVPFERAQPLFPFLSMGLGDWRPFFPNDRVRIWLDERNWFPLKWSVYPAAGAERDAWALRFGLAEEPSLRPVFIVSARDVSTRTPPADVFRIPASATPRDQGARAVGLGDVQADVGFEPVAPATVGG